MGCFTSRLAPSGSQTPRAGADNPTTSQQQSTNNTALDVLGTASPTDAPNRPRAFSDPSHTSTAPTLPLQSDARTNLADARRHLLDQAENINHQLSPNNMSTASRFQSPSREPRQTRVSRLRTRWRRVRPSDAPDLTFHSQPTQTNLNSHVFFDEAGLPLTPGQPPATLRRTESMPMTMIEAPPTRAPHTSRPSKKRKKEPQPQCCICLNDYSAEEAVTELVQPCSCTQNYCKDCLKQLFTRATKDASCMPPKCCTILIPIHEAASLLTPQEAANFREKFEEWSTIDRTYCPIPTCSAFISPRDLKRARTGYDDLGGTANPLLQDTAAVACPKCSVIICTACTQLYHAPSPCPATADSEIQTLAALEKWGYKRCPKCKHGVRKMFGCTHMSCLCGAQWCWSCQKPIDDCDRNCASDDEDEEDDESEDEDDDDSVIGQPEEIPHTPGGSVIRSTTPPGMPEIAPTVDLSPQRSPRRERENLDGRSAGYWEQTSLDFGEEPSDENQDRAWFCTHNYESFEVTFKSMETHKRPEKYDKMECHRCWRRTVPDVKVEPRMILNRAYGKDNNDPTIVEHVLWQSWGAKAIVQPGDTNHLVADTAVRSLAYRCTQCGLFVCKECSGAGEKKAESKEE